MSFDYWIVKLFFKGADVHFADNASVLLFWTQDLWWRMFTLLYFYLYFNIELSLLCPQAVESTDLFYSHRWGPLGKQRPPELKSDHCFYSPGNFECLHWKITANQRADYIRSRDFSCKAEFIFTFFATFSVFCNHDDDKSSTITFQWK